MMSLLILIVSALTSSLAILGGHYWRNQRLAVAGPPGRLMLSATRDARMSLLLLWSVILTIATALYLGLHGAHL